MMMSLRLLLIASIFFPCVNAQVENFQEWRFKQSVDRAMQAVKQILDTTRNPRLLEDSDHVYEDKYLLADFLTNTIVAAEMNALGALGITNDVFDVIWKTVHEDKRSVTLRFQAEQTSHFVKEEEVKAVAHESEVEHTEITDDGESSFWGRGGEKSKTSKTKIYEKVLEQHWQAVLNAKLTVFFGSENDNAMVLQNRTASRSYVTSTGIRSVRETKETPPDKTKTFDTDINLTWLIQMLSKDKTSQFAIDRFSDDAKEKCRTPRRNPEIEAAFEFLLDFRDWAERVVSFFQEDVAQLVGDSPAQLSMHRSFLDKNRDLAKALFLPTVPLLENSTLLSKMDLGKLLKEQARRIEEVNGSLESSLTEKDPVTLAASVGGNIIVMCFHIDELCKQYVDSVNYIEHLLRKQLTRAIGKEVTAADFEGFMESHYRKMFGASYAPKLFSYAVRRPDHYPDGALSIEGPSPRDVTRYTNYEPVQTFVNHLPKDASSPPIFIPINAATSIEVKGDRYLHGWLQHRFDMSVQRRDRFRLAARAHQFSNFLLVVGTMAGPDKFQPRSAIVLQNKDEVLIPLITEVIPSAKEFKDAISSLSPEQQAFAKAFRAMQLESSLFGVCVIQLKPQLELLLGLPAHSLTKEIKLTQDLMSLFVEYQIPSDLLSVSDELPSGSTADKLQSVKENVKAVMDVIDQAKEEQLQEEKRKKDMRDTMNPSDCPSACRTGGPTATPTGSPSDGPSASPSSSPSASPSASPSSSPSDSARSGARQAFAATRSMEQIEMMGGETVQAAASPKSMKDTMSSNQEEQATQKTENTEPGPPSGTKGTSTSPVASDFTLIPKLLDSQIEKHDQDGSLRSTIVKADSRWTRARKENLLTPSHTETMLPKYIEKEQKMAFDLLDALSRSGNLPIEQSELHIVVVLSHCFEDDIMSTIIKDNINPIEKVERSSLLIASTIHGRAVPELIGDSTTLDRLTNTFPGIIDATSETSE